MIPDLGPQCPSRSTEQITWGRWVWAGPLHLSDIYPNKKGKHLKKKKTFFSIFLLMNQKAWPKKKSVLGLGVQFYISSAVLLIKLRGLCD